MHSNRFRLSAAAYPAGTRQAPHAHDELQITVVLHGQLEERVETAVERPTALSVVAKDPGVVHEDLFTTSADTLTAQLSIPNASLADFVEHPGRARAWRWAHDLRVALPFLRIVARGLRGTRHFVADDDDIVDLLAAVSARGHAPPRADAPRWLTDAVHQACDEWRPGVTVRELAANLGLHPVYFARCVRRWYGTGAAELLRKSRLRHAARAVADGGGTIAAVAHATGFADESHFSREFAKATGLPPARYRRLARGFAGF